MPNTWAKSRYVSSCRQALAEKSLAQSIGQPSLITLAYTIEEGRKDYCAQLERHQRTLDIAGWLIYFSQSILTAQRATLSRFPSKSTRANSTTAFATFSTSARKKWWPECSEKAQQGSRAA
jgi:Fic family protein